MSRRKKRPSPDPPPPGEPTQRLPDAGREHGILSRVLLVGLGIVGALVLAEIGVRVFDLGPRIGAVHNENYQLSENPVLRYELRPGSRLGPVTINSAGMRDREVTVEKPPRTFRIATIGDSIGFGYGTHQGGAYPGRLEEFLNRAYGDQGWRFEVLNFCVTGYNITQAVEMLESRALAFVPDLVIYGYCLNDPQDYSFELEQLRAKLTVAEDGYRERLTRSGERLALHSRLYAIARYALAARSSSSAGPRQVRPEPDWAALRRGSHAAYFRGLHAEDGEFARVEAGLSRLAAVARKRGVPTYVATFPIFKELTAYSLTDVHAKVAAAAEKEGLRSVDLAPLYRELEGTEPGSFAFDELHPNAKGHAFAALAVLEEMLSRGDLPVADRDLRRLAAGGGTEARWAQRVMALSRAKG
jgi:lysophospholipase L1-like esterase